jgi:hypothetical protein
MYTHNPPIASMVFSASDLSWFTRYINAYNLQFLHNVIYWDQSISDTGILSWFRLFYLGSLFYCFQKTVKYLDFQSFSMYVPREGYYRNASFALSLISEFVLPTMRIEIYLFTLSFVAAMQTISLYGTPVLNVEMWILFLEMLNNLTLKLNYCKFNMYCEYTKMYLWLIKLG